MKRFFALLTAALLWVLVSCGKPAPIPEAPKAPDTEQLQPLPAETSPAPELPEIVEEQIFPVGPSMPEVPMTPDETDVPIEPESPVQQENPPVAQHPEPPQPEQPELPEAPPATEPPETTDFPETPEPPSQPEQPAPTTLSVEELLDTLTLEEKVGQLFFTRCPAKGAAEDAAAYHLGGYILFGQDFKDANGSWLTKKQFISKVDSYQTAALGDTGIPLLIGVDEEGGTVARASRNPHLFPEKFRSPQELLAALPEQENVFFTDAREKSLGLLDLGINVNLAPVADVATDPDSFIYPRVLGRDAAATADYVTEVVSAMRDAGIGSVLKHFPGYGENEDTHTGIAVDLRPYQQFLAEDLLPFRAGKQAGGPTAAVLVSHNIVTCMDETLPASLSPEVLRVLRQEVGFTGVAMTDDLAMDAVAAYCENGSAPVLALQAGIDLIISSDHAAQIAQVLAAVESGTLSSAVIDDACRRVLTWKQALGLL